MKLSWRWKLLRSAVLLGTQPTNLRRRSVWYLCEGEVTVQEHQPTRSNCLVMSSSFVHCCILRSLLLSDKKRADEQRIENKLGMCLTSISFWKKKKQQLFLLYLSLWFYESGPGHAAKRRNLGENQRRKSLHHCARIYLIRCVVDFKLGGVSTFFLERLIRAAAYMLLLKCSFSSLMVSGKGDKH
jgi:hypothetical protein